MFISIPVFLALLAFAATLGPAESDWRDTYEGRQALARWPRPTWRERIANILSRLGDVAYWACICGVLYLAALALETKDHAYVHGAGVLFAVGWCVRYVLNGKID